MATRWVENPGCRTDFDIPEARILSFMGPKEVEGRPLGA